MATTDELLAAQAIIGAPRQKLIGTVRTSAGGVGTVILEPKPPAGTFYLVDRGALIAEGPAAGTVRWIIYTGEAEDLNMEDFADLAVGAAAAKVRAIGEWSPPIYVPSQTDLLAVVSGATGSTQARVRATARRFRSREA